MYKNRILPAITDMRGAVFNTADLTKKINGVSGVKKRRKVFVQELMPSKIANSGEAHLPAEPSSGAQKTALYAVQFFHIALKTVCIALPFRAAPLTTLTAAALGYYTYPLLYDPLMNPKFHEPISLFQPIPPSIPSLQREANTLSDHLGTCLGGLAIPILGPLFFGFCAGRAIRFYRKGVSA